MPTLNFTVDGAGGLYGNDLATISYTFTPGTPMKKFLRLQMLSD